MRAKCPYSFDLCSKSGCVIRFGRYFRKSEGRWVPRYKCTHCNRHFSGATNSPNINQNKRYLNRTIHQLLASGNSQRRLSRILGISRTTISRKLQFLAKVARISNERFLNSWPIINSVQFDDLETFEHTKMKPLSVTLAVEKETRFIIGIEVSSMPVKGLLVKKSLKKYGRRRDHRAIGRNELFRRIKSRLNPRAIIESDQNPHYPKSIKQFFPNARHIPLKGIRGCITAQGELKKTTFDPLFSLNHTCAMLRANINRLFRKTWCTTKKIERLKDHLELYIQFHNQELISAA